MAKRPTRRPATARNNTDRGDFNHPALDYRPPKLLRRVNAALALLVSTLLVAGLWSFAWYAVSAYVKAQVAGWTEAQAARGAIAAYEAMDTAGFPARIVLTLTKPRYEGPLAGETIAWQGEVLTLSVRPWMPWVIHAEAAGRHDIAIGGGRQAFSGAVRHLSAEINPGPAWPERLRLNVEGLTMGGSAPLGAAALSLDVRHDPKVEAGGVGLTVALTGQDVTLPMADWGLGTTMHTLDAALRVNGPVRPGILAERLEAWRAVGGAVEVDRLKLRLGPLGLAATGTVALDGALQPVGALTAKFEGLFQVLEILRRRGIVRDADAVFATMALAALSRRPANGGPASINLAVSVQDGTVSLGPVPVFRLPHFDWGAPPEPALPQAPAAPVRDYKDAPPVY